MARFNLLWMAAFVAVLGGAGALAAPEVGTLRFHADCLDLDSGMVLPCRSAGSWDVGIDYFAPAAVHAIVRQNVEQGLEIAWIEGGNFASVTAADVAGAVFSVEPLHVHFGPDTVLLLRTDMGAVFKLGLPSEGPLDVTLAYERIDGGSGS